MPSNVSFTPQKNIFLLVSGLFPQIVTETLYAFYINKKLSTDIPAEVHLITTKEGANNARLQLLAPNTRYFSKLLETYDIHNVHFDESCIHVIEDQNGTPLADIRTPDQNSSAANFISHLVQSFTEDNEVALHVSLAGGRKTMGYYIGYALSLFGRPQDTLSHVLVSEVFENNRDFFFPTKESHIIYNREQDPIDAKEAIVELAEIPFVRLRGELPPEFLSSKRTFNETVELINSSQAKQTLILDVKRKIAICNGIEVKLERLNFYFYLWLVYKKIDGTLPLQAPYREIDKLNDAYGLLFKEMLLSHNLWDELPTRSQISIESGIDRQSFNIKCSYITRDFKKSLGQTLAKNFIPSFDKMNDVTYVNLPIEANSIAIKWNYP